MQSTLPSTPDTAPALRRTKIVATLGPATDKSGVLEAMIRAGVDVVRINFSHGGHADHERRVALVREAAAACNTDVGILADLQGPKIRIGQFAAGSVVLEEDATFVLDAALDETAGTQEAVSVTYKDLPADVNAGDILLLNDGLIVLSVEQVADSRIHCRVVSGGELSNNKGINRQGGGLTAPALTE
ncbi:MAG TPA: pyruvate kinase, partial [Gammaproteobacteria bacterium]|nr:pyruvate kinase [Gammaproteobacteria bacterium]